MPFDFQPTPLIEPHRQPPIKEWLGHTLGIEIASSDTAEVLFFERFGRELSAIVLLPESFSLVLPRPNRTFSRELQPPRLDRGDSYTPPKRVPRENIGPGERTLGIELVNCREVTLRISTARVSYWGINLELLPPMPEAEPTADAFLQWLVHNNLDQRAIVSPEAEALLYAAFVSAVVARNDPTFTPPRLPLIHNQRCGMRYRLCFDKRKMGSPCDIHVLLYAPGRKPLLYGIPAIERPSADERKQGLGLLESWDKRIRFYQTTAAQWAEWNRSPLDLSAFPAPLRPDVEAGIEAAHRLRKVT